jgi:hypothetical protein
LRILLDEVDAASVTGSEVKRSGGRPMMERETWGSGQIARPGFSPRRPGDEFSWAFKVLRSIKGFFGRFQVAVRELLHHGWTDRSFVHAKR